MSESRPMNRAALFVVTVAAAVLLFSGCDRAPSDMVLVEEGGFVMGSDEGAPDEGPGKNVTLRGFYIDTYEVTNAKYREFVKETERGKPRKWVVHGWKDEYAAHPVVFVSYEDAEAYCEWAGKRLPSEAEWEKAARGTDKRHYPWGDDFEASKANTSLSGIVGTTEVGKYETGASPYGALDMSGNVWEWTSSDYNEKTKVVRGGSWGLTHRFARTFSRVGYSPTTKINNLGLRCAKDR